MRSKYKRSFTAITLLILLAVMQAYAAPGRATRNSSGTDSSAAPQQISGILTTQANKPITINGASAATGATILSGAMIETPDGVTATITIPGHGTLEIAANTKLTLEIDQNGNIKVNLIQGCLVLHTLKGTSGEVDNAQGVIGKTDSTKNDELNVCPVRTAGAAAGGGGLSTGEKVAIVAAVGGGLGVALGFGLRGSNPSPGAP